MLEATGMEGAEAGGRKEPCGCVGDLTSSWTSSSGISDWVPPPWALIMENFGDPRKGPLRHCSALGYTCFRQL